MTSAIGTFFTQLFSARTTAGVAVSEPFRLDNRPSQIAKPSLRTYGSLGTSGTVVLQTLHPSKNPMDPTAANYPDVSASSTDYQNTDDVIVAQGHKFLEQSKLWYRLKITLGAGASFNAEIIDNA